MGCSSSKSATAPLADAGYDSGTSPTDATVDALADASSDAVPDTATADIPEPTYGGMVEPGCQVNGCIRGLGTPTVYSTTTLNAFADPSFTVKNGVSEYPISYWSDGQEIRGSLFIPDTPAPADGFGVVVINQPTSGIGAPCSPASGLLGVGFASSAALSGFVTLLPDGTTYGPPPYGAYMVAKTAGRAALDAVRAALHTTIQPIAQRAVIAGLSQGAFSTMGAARELPGYAPHIPVRGFIAAEPPSQLEQSFQASAIADNSQITYDAMRLYSWQGFYHLDGGPIFRGSPDASPAPDDAGPDAGPVDYAVEAPIWFASKCVYNADLSPGKLFNMFPYNASSVLSDAFLGYVTSGNWPKEWADVYAASVSVPTGLTQPVLVFEGTADVTVYPAQAQKYVATLLEAGVNVDFRLIDGGVHGSTALGSFTSPQTSGNQAIDWMAAQLAK